MALLVEILASNLSRRKFKACPTRLGSVAVINALNWILEATESTIIAVDPCNRPWNDLEGRPLVH